MKQFYTRFVSFAYIYINFNMNGSYFISTKTRAVLCFDGLWAGKSQYIMFVSKEILCFVLRKA
jgi:hypothetical protein